MKPSDLLTTAEVLANHGAGKPLDANLRRTIRGDMRRGAA